MSAHESYVRAKFSTQGKSPGQSPRLAHTDKIPVLRIEHRVDAPRDVSTGVSLGKRHHKPVTLLMEIGASTAFWYNAATQNELLPEVIIEMWGKNKKGEDEQTFQMTLTDAHVVSVRYMTGRETSSGDAATAGTAKNAGEFDTQHLMEVALSFRKIAFEDKLKGTMHSDDFLTAKANA